MSIKPRAMAALFWLVLTSAAAGAGAVTPGQKLTVERITSIFENSTADFRYDYIEDIDDGAGVTCGRVGFTSSELLLITGRYVALKGADTALARYLPCLRDKGEDISADYSCLFPSVPKEKLTTPEFKKEGGGIAAADFGRAWVEAGADPVMKKIQDDYTDETYFQPALKTVRALGLRTPLALAFVYDAMIQMDTEPLFAAIGSRFATAHGGRVKPSGAAEETEWLRLYIPERKKQLSVTPAGAATTSRVDALEQILNTGNFKLTLPIEFGYCGGNFIIAADK